MLKMYKGVQDRLVELGHKKTHAAKLVKGMAEHAKNMGFQAKVSKTLAENATPSQVDKKAVRNKIPTKGSAKSPDNIAQPKVKTRGRPRKTKLGY